MVIDVEVEWVTEPRKLISNYDELSPADQKRAEEVIYRRQLKWMHGWKPGEKMLLSKKV